MGDIEFNLLDEPWIRVMTAQHGIKEVSLTDVLVNSQEYADFAGELAAQDIAVLRLCLAVLHTVFCRYDVDGEEAEVEDRCNALDRWESLWQRGAFPEEPIRRYLQEYRERFWLFHPKTPFYQANEAANGTEYTAAKLNGEISESSNKVRMFALRSGEEKSQLSYPEAARWLLFVNGFDDTSAKPRKKGLPSPGAGWIGRLGIVEAVGHNLFETLMLNLVFERPGDEWNENVPIWEQEPRGEERTEISQPNNPAQLLTLQSRRLLLIRKKDKVTGYYLLGGDFFQKVNIFMETMTTWSAIENKAGGMEQFQPKRHDPGKQMWREFGNLFFEEAENGKGKHLPGVVSWIAVLRLERRLTGREKVTFRSVAVQYGDKDFFIADTFSDSLTFHSYLFEETEWKNWGMRIQNEVKACERIAQLVGDLAKRILLAVGSEKGSGDEARAEFYRRIDVPFRSWLENIEPWKSETQDDYADGVCQKWHKTAFSIAKQLGENLIENSGPAAYVGRMIKADGTGKDQDWYCCAPKAYNIFLSQLIQVYGDGGRG